jgi:hypothetical protein
MWNEEKIREELGGLVKFLESHDRLEKYVDSDHEIDERDGYITTLDYGVYDHTVYEYVLLMRILEEPEESYRWNY